MKWIVDASVALKWVVHEEGSARAALLANHELSAPDLLLTECANALWVKARRGELERKEAKERLEALGSAPIRFRRTTELVRRAFELASDLDHPVYDCLYLAMAIEEITPVVTADRRFVTAVRRNEELIPMICSLDELR